MTYTVNATLVEGQGWHVEVPEVQRVTQARNVDEIDTMARDLIEIMTGEAADSVNLDVSMILPAIVAERIAEATRQRDVEQVARSAAAQASREAALGLKVSGLSMRDIGKVLGVSHQRASQLTNRKVPMTSARANMKVKSGGSAESVKVVKATA